MKNIIISCALLLVLVASGCGYHLPGSGTSLPEDINTLCIEPFANKTTEPFIETQLTNEVRDQFARRQTMQVVSSDAQADAILSGNVTSYRSNSITYDQNDDITEYRVTMVVEAKLVRSVDSEVIWQGTVQWQEEFYANDDRAEQDYSESEAQETLTRRLAQEVYNRITDDF
ncbi:MAG: LptE family protein [Desulfuromonas sp.]|nr:LptE family protein [Desulfuromonas sp.]